MALPSGFVFDPQSDAFARDPYPTYAALRDHGQPWYFDGYDIWLLSRYADVQAAAVNPRLIRSLDGIATPDEIAARRQRDNWHDMPFHSRFVQFSMLNSDGEVHQRLRKMLFRECQSATLARLKGEIDAHVAPLIAALSTEFDFIADLATTFRATSSAVFWACPTKTALSCVYGRKTSSSISTSIAPTNARRWPKRPRPTSIIT